MKKYIVMSIIAVVALLPFAAWAHTGGSALATLTFEAVLNMIVDGDDWGDLTIKQSDMDGIVGAGGFGAGGLTDWDDAADDITVTVQAFTNFTVFGSYYSVGTNLTLPLVADQDLFIYLGAKALKWADWSGGPAADTAFDYNSSTMPATSGLTNLLWTGLPTMWVSPFHEQWTYNVKWDPSKLPSQDLKAGSTMDVTIYFVVTDSTV